MRQKSGTPRAASEQIVKAPSPSGMRSKLVDAPLSDLRGKHRTEPVPPEPHFFVADIDAALEQQTLYLPR